MGSGGTDLASVWNFCLSHIFRIKSGDGRGEHFEKFAKKEREGDLMVSTWFWEKKYCFSKKHYIV